MATTARLVLREQPKPPEITGDEFPGVVRTIEEFLKAHPNAELTYSWRKDSWYAFDSSSGEDEDDGEIMKGEAVTKLWKTADVLNRIGKSLPHGLGCSFGFDDKGKHMCIVIDKFDLVRSVHGSLAQEVWHEVDKENDRIERYAGDPEFAERPPLSDEFGKEIRALMSRFIDDKDAIERNRKIAWEACERALRPWGAGLVVPDEFKPGPGYDMMWVVTGEQEKEMAKR